MNQYNMGMNHEGGRVYLLTKTKCNIKEGNKTEGLLYLRID